VGPFPGGESYRAAAKTGIRHVLIIRGDDSGVWTIRMVYLSGRRTTNDTIEGRIIN